MSTRSYKNVHNITSLTKRHQTPPSLSSHKNNEPYQTLQKNQKTIHTRSLSPIIAGRKAVHGGGDDGGLGEAQELADRPLDLGLELVELPARQVRHSAGAAYRR